MPETEAQSSQSNILGLSTADLAGLSAGELTGNETAIKMLLHYYRELLNDNIRLKNESNTFKTYVDAYQRQKSNSATGGILLAVSNISIGFGVNLITGTPTLIIPGVSSMIVGVSLIVAGIYFTFFKDPA